ncbi:uncharacterized protein [Enoplosus armatus]|uniref:uncharacterized protein n=1 Tax=Enoplosus armatus TaxID=215367 RepID=UPI003993EC85
MSVALILLGNIAIAAALPGDNNETGQNLDCTNDYETSMVCRFQAQNCTEYNLTLQSNNGYGVKSCHFKQCDTGQCCCSVEIVLVRGETHTATVWKGGESMKSKIINVIDSIKPKTPTIISVNESNGNFQVKWTKNMVGHLSDTLTACVAYHKKGDTEKISECFKATTIDGLNYYEILGQRLEPSTTYVVSVKSYTDWSDRYSDSSEEWEFTTPLSSNSLLLTIIIILSIAAVIISSAIFGCYVKFKTQWDTVAKCQNPKLLIIQPSEQELLKPVPPIISSMCVVPFAPDDSKPWSKQSLRDTSSGSLQQSSGISTGSSCLSYANTEPADIIASVQDALDKAFANISPISPLTPNSLKGLNKDSGLFCAPYNPCSVRADGMNSGSSGFDNKTYSILIPSCSHEIMTDSSEVQMHAEMPCDSVCHPSEGDILICPDNPLPACLFVNLPPVVSTLMPTDMSYQQCNADSGRFSSAEDSSLSSISSGPNTTASCDPVSRVEGFDQVLSGATKLNGKTEEATICDENPCYRCVPAGSHSFPPVVDDYQAFQNLVEQPDILFSEKRSVEKEEHLSKHPEELFTKMPRSLSPVFPGSINNVQDGQCLSELQRPFLSLISADQSMPVISDSGYQSV